MDLHTERGEVSIRELADRTGISKSTLHRIEKGERPATPGEVLLVQAALQGNGQSNGKASSDEPAPGRAPAAAPAQPSERANECYPAAPSEKRARRAWMSKRNKAMQTVGVTPADGQSFGTGKVPK